MPDKTEIVSVRGSLILLGYEIKVNNEFLLRAINKQGIEISIYFQQPRIIIAIHNGSQKYVNLKYEKSVSSETIIQDIINNTVKKE